MLRKLPLFALIAAPLLGVFCVLGLYYSDRLLPTLIRRDWQFFLLNGGLMVMLNWRLLSEPGLRRRVWTATLLLLAFTSLCHAYTQHRFHAFSGNYPYDFGAGILLSTVTQIGALFIAAFSEKNTRRPADVALAVCANRFIFNALLYGLFIGLTLLVFVLGFALLRLVHLDLWQMLEGAGQEILIGLCLGLNLLILNLAPLPERERPFPYLHIFQYIALVFALFYLVVLPFAGTTFDSGQRLAIAAVLWLLAIWLYDREQPRVLTNLLTAGTGIALALLSLRGIVIRIDAYGLSEDRAYALFLAFVLLVAHGGLLLKILALHRQAAMAQRTFAATIVLLMAAAVANALLPLPRWVLASQVARYTTGGADPSELHEYSHPYAHYGKAGGQALQDIYRYHNGSQAVAKLGAVYFPRVEANLSWDERSANAKQRFLAAMQTFPADFQPEDAVVSAASISYNGDYQPLLLRTDADHDGIAEILLLEHRAIEGGRCTLYRYDDKRQTFNYFAGQNCSTGTDPVAALRQHGIRYERSRYDDIIIGDLRLKLND